MGVYRCTETGGGGGGVLYSRQQCYLRTIQGGLGDW